MVKIIQVQSTYSNHFPMECKAGNHTVYVDHPQAAGGQDTAASPIQYLLAGFAGCLSSVARIVAKQQNISFRGISLNIEGELDPAGYRGEPTEHRVGLLGIKIKATIDADLTPEGKKQFLREIDRRCPISETLQHGTIVSLESAE